MIAVGNNGGVIFWNGSWFGFRLGHKNLRTVAQVPGLVVTAGDDGAIYTSHGAPNFNPRDSGTGKSLSGILLLPESRVDDEIRPPRALIVGDDGCLLSSVDGGATWSRSTRGSKHLHAVT
jgi:hypothetical protein